VLGDKFNPKGHVLNLVTHLELWEPLYIFEMAKDYKLCIWHRYGIKHTKY